MAVILSRQFEVPSGPSAGAPASDFEIGGSVRLMVNNELRDFIIVHHGNPDTGIYDASCDGTWLLMKDIYDFQSWSSPSGYTYDESLIHTYLNGDFLNLLDAHVKAQIKIVKIPYSKYLASPETGSNGLSARVFLLSVTEVGWTTDSKPQFTNDGACLDYFRGTAETDSKRIAYIDGTASSWWLRTPITVEISQIVNADGGHTQSCTQSIRCGIRPALILPSNAMFDPVTREFMGVA